MPLNQFSGLLLRLHPFHKVLAGLIVSLLVYLLVRNAHLNSLVLYMLLWETFGLTYILITWCFFFTRPVEEIRKVARIDDGGRTFVYGFILVASFASMVTVLLLILSKEAGDTSMAVYLPVAIGGILISWWLIHTTLSIHYANLYYDDDETDRTKYAGGLSFPHTKTPDYLDFAYFAFVIGMTFQVSDVQISSRKVRRVALVHGLLSFFLNTFAVALTVNLIAGIRG
ncbi:DUF1345 domain-containing protein [Chitinophaga sp. GCM10012297]|uniref:DUF1345 domain-containing protein n=1 Tax=Chitinophaga chungangae TaxID=2821488 RepID=A0ABS3YC61_9BACT|nr:DUF1345 domain-containing protein [Chitinophaga chungangae]MBO9152254.1 DUF1345 domain-containing protein [Chitinophaga chungangae]